MRGLEPGTDGNAPEGPVLITGGAGFIGTNLANRLLENGEQVVLFDNLSRAGVEQNIDWLRATHGDAVRLIVADVQDARALRRAVQHSGSIFHFAAQVAVTTSLEDPLLDFEVNARGTLNLLSAWREMHTPCPLVFTSTNKVYGSLEGLSLREQAERYEPTDPAVRNRGVGEDRGLHFYSPYGCSKGAADQYVLDHAQTFGLPAAVFRMSCIYGPHQCGTEDQGWVAHFLIQAQERQRLMIYGDGKQVRDILFVEDLLDAFLLAREQMGKIAGQAFNIGGGPANTTSLLELLELIETLEGQATQVSFAEWRPGDQKYYVSDTTKFQEVTGWRPKVPAKEGVRRLHRWLRDTALARENAAAALRE
jgi:CDP-paratose 2-epimerase